MRPIERWILVIIVCLFCVCPLQAERSDGVSVTSPAAGSVVPRVMSFAGVVKDATGKVVTGSVNLTFSLYALEEGGIALWSETQSVQPDDQGHYTVLLGATHPEGLPLDLFTTGAARWLGVQPQLPGVGEQPRILLVGVPYALKAADAETLGGKPASAFVTAESLSSSGAESSTPSNRATSPSGQPAAQAFKKSAREKEQSTATNSVGGSGATNFIPIWTNSTTLGNSTMFETGGKVGIGTTTPGAVLQVNNTSPIFSIYATGSQGGLAFQMRDGAVNSQWYGLGNVSRFWRSDRGDIIGVTSAGNVGIGTTSPGSTLDVFTNSQHMLAGGFGCPSGFVGVGFGTTATCGNYSLLGNGKDTYVNRPTGGNIHFREGNGADQVTLATGGKVGIGTTAPGAVLQVNNTSPIFSIYATGSQGGLAFQMRDGTVNSQWYGLGNVSRFWRSDKGDIIGVTSAGNVGIGTTSPSHTLEVVAGGTTLADAWTTRSSRRWKTNVRTLGGALEKVEHLRGVSYDLKSNGKHEIGVIAEEVGRVLPEVVTYEKNGVDAQGVDYGRLTALLIEATKQQQQEIRRQQAQIRRQQITLTALQGQLAEAQKLLRQVKAEQATARSSAQLVASSRSPRGRADDRNE